jgi:hypothetical protein
MAAAAEPGPVGTGEGDGSIEITGVLDGVDPIVSVQATVVSAKTTAPATDRPRNLTGVEG